MRETETVQVGEGQRERERERDRENHSRLYIASIEPNVGLEAVRS